MEDVTPLEELLAGLRGEVQSSGEFTLAAERARDKLRQFQLANLYDYPVFLVAGAVAGGAAWVRIDQRGSLLRFDASSPDLTWADLHALFPSLLGGQGRPDLQSLAIGLNAALALEPASVTLLSTRAALELKPGHPDQLVKLECSPFDGPNPPQLRVLVQLKKRLWQSTGRELKAVATRCAWAPLHLMGNGRPLTASFTGRALATVAWDGPQPLPHIEVQTRVSRRFEGQPRSLFLALGAKESGCWCMVDGIRHPVGGLGEHVLAVAAGEGIALSLSRELVEDEALEALRAEVREAEQAGLDALAHDYLSQPSDETRQLLLASRHDEAPVLVTAEGYPLSLRGLREAVAEQGAFYYTRRKESLKLATRKTIVRLDPVCEPVLTALYPEQLSGERFVEGNTFGSTNKQRWEQATRLRPELQGQFLVQVPLVGVPGEVGIPSSPTVHLCQVRLLLEGRELAVQAFPTLPRCLFAIAEPPGLKPNPTFDGADPQPALDRVREAVEYALDALERRLLDVLAEPRPGHSALLAALEMGERALRKRTPLARTPFMPLADGTRADLVSLLDAGLVIGEEGPVVSEPAMGGLAPLYKKALRRLAASG